jgi:hypothetical protein
MRSLGRLSMNSSKHLFLDGEAIHVLAVQREILRRHLPDKSIAMTISMPLALILASPWGSCGRASAMIMMRLGDPTHSHQDFAAIGLMQGSDAFHQLH